MFNIDAAEGRTVALYWDFENIHAGLCEEKEPGSYRNPDARFRPQEPLVNVQAVVDLAASFGPIAINRAYCNWQFYGRYRDALLQNAVELVQLFPPGTRKATNRHWAKSCHERRGARLHEFLRHAQGHGRARRSAQGRI